MDNFLELIQAVQSDLTIGDESSLMGLPTVKLAINRAYINKVSAIFRWPQTDDAKITDTQANLEYYEYPELWRPNSIWKLKVDSIDYGEPLLFADYEYEKENNFPHGETKIWSNKALYYFIRPIPTTNGDGNIEVHGQFIPSKLVNDDDITVFSYNMPELNEAIVLEAKAILNTKVEKEQSSSFASAEAKQICVTAWSKLKSEQGKYEKTRPMFIVQDYFGRQNSNTNIGNFNRR